VLKNYGAGELSLDMIHEINESIEEDIAVAGFLPVWVCNFRVYASG
jgi:hypothetical protein